jgi:hypothetical protein
VARNYAASEDRGHGRREHAKNKQTAVERQISPRNVSPKTDARRDYDCLRP